MERRTFLSALPVLAVGASGGPLALGLRRAPESPPEEAPASPGERAALPEAIGVQLYTLRTVMDDPPATLAALADLGYREVELAGIYGLTPAAFRAILDDAGLRAPSTHVPLERLEGDAFSALLDEAETLGNEWLIVPSLPRESYQADGFRQVADALNRAGETARGRGMGVGFHNHDGEFMDVGDGETGLGLMLAGTDPALVSFQLDLFWATHAGQDPLAWFAAHPGRFVSVHAKDRTGSGDMVAVGDGAMDFPALLAAGEAAGVRHVFVEHDRPDDPLDSVARSIRYLESLRV